ncbi:drug resistance protein MdrA [Lophiotrema nucula]|uniref:Topoisomerase 1-associated factor 1 n=1 Tax=Lophiotrema nucula TaxID=690887 RepID=A0A6A5Z9V7_9PLEO|nr:drug resistance protein MdrA [Lophiotrema nucula]
MAQQTTLEEWAKDPVDPEIRAHVYSLISALGGIGDDGTYALGTDALLVLKDLRKWLKFADQQLNRRDVARCMAEANLVKGDLLEILAKLDPKIVGDKLKHKIAMACLELLVPLTWPFEIDPQEATVNQVRHNAYIELAQINYKRSILQFDRARILQSAVRIALPSMAIPLRERSPRDDGIIRIALYFLRNIVMLSPPKSTPMDVDEAEVSRSTVIDTFAEQEIFQVLLSVASSIGEDFVTQDVIVLEVLFYLLKGVDPGKLFMAEKEKNKKETEELKDLIQKEKAMLAGYVRHAPTRHNRFGTMIWLKREDNNVSTISGQDVLGKAQKSLEHMDKSKKWNKPKQGRRKNDKEVEAEEFDLAVALTTSARKTLKAFTEEFLDSSFNPLFLHLRKAIERETDRVEDRHSKQYFYLVSWFLRAECSRRRTIREYNRKNPQSIDALNAEDESYGLVAEVMNQETFILLNRFMQKSQDEKAWQNLNAGMKCLTQILLTVQEMSDSALEEDQEIAENIQNRIFYEESTHDRIVYLLRNYNGQGFGYLDAVTELSHVFLRMLERYSKMNVDMQIRSRRRTRKIAKKRAQVSGEANDDTNDPGEQEEMQAAQKTVSERKFDFMRFCAKFINQGSVNTFVAFLKFFQELDTEQLKRAHRFLYRVAFKMELDVLLMRVDILALLNKIIKGPDGLDMQSPVFREWEDFVRHFFRTTVKKVQERPELIVEMLFSKIPATLFYLEHGYDKEVIVRAPRAPAELEIKPGMEKPEQTGVAVAVLVNQNKSDALRWLREVLTSAAEERRGWVAEEEARKTLAEQTRAERGEPEPEDPVGADIRRPPSILVKPDNGERRMSLFKDNKLRLLLNLVGFMRLGDTHGPEATWVIPSSLSSEELEDSINLIRKFEFDPPVYEDGKTAEDYLRSKAAGARRSTRRAEFDDDSTGDENDSEKEANGDFDPSVGPTARKPDAPRKTLRRRKRLHTPRELDDEEMELKAEKRRQRKLEKLAKEKSKAYIYDSDEDSDDEVFFAREEALRQKTLAHFKRLLTLGSTETSTSKKRKADEGGKTEKKRRKTPPKKSAPFDTDDSEAEDAGPVEVSSRASSSEPFPGVAGSESEEEATDTPLSSQHAPLGDDGDYDNAGSAKTSTPVAPKQQDMTMAGVDDEDEEEGTPVMRRPAARTRAGFVIDSDSE